MYTVGFFCVSSEAEGQQVAGATVAATVAAASEVVVVCEMARAAAAAAAHSDAEAEEEEEAPRTVGFFGDRALSCRRAAELAFEGARRETNWARWKMERRFGDRETDASREVTFSAAQMAEREATRRLIDLGCK
jgi:hypothetical protein